MAVISTALALAFGASLAGSALRVAEAEPRKTTRLAFSVGSSMGGSSVGGSRTGAPAPRVAGGRSVGSPTEGHLVGGVRIEESPWLRIVPCHRDEDVRWGIEALVSIIDRGARAVRKQFPDSVLSVGHLSRREGGEIDAHASHESGRDADVGFYVVNQQGKSIFAEHFVPFVGDGTAPSWPGAKFDDARNWAFIASIVTDPHAHVSHVFVATPLRVRLLAYAQRIGAPYATRVRASEVMAQPRAGLPHDDHFHVRISCPPGMEGCIEQPTRSVARARRGPRHARDHAALAAPPPVPSATPASPSPGTNRATGAAEHERAHPKGSPVPSEDLPAIPSAPPPALLESPIDDVDGVEGDGE
jgi:penicillin-insensitive murein endopeptidase